MARPAEPSDRASDAVHSRSNPLLRRLRALARHAGQGEDLLLLEGVRLLEEALDAGLAVVELAATPRALQDPRCRRSVEAAERRGAARHLVGEQAMGSLSELTTSQGLLAIARRPRFSEAQVLDGTPFLLVAVGVQNPGNLGALLRTAEAAGATGACVCGGTADPFSWKALRGSMGSAFRLPQLVAPEPAALLGRLHRRGIRSVAAVAGAGGAYDEADLTGPLALLVGNEGAGLPPEIEAAAQVRLAIPMAGRVESLNVGVAAGILLFEAARQRRRAGAGR